MCHSGTPDLIYGAAHPLNAVRWVPTHIATSREAHRCPQCTSNINMAWRNVRCSKCWHTQKRSSPLSCAILYCLKASGMPGNKTSLKLHAYVYLNVRLKLRFHTAAWHVDTAGEHDRAATRVL